MKKIILALLVLSLLAVITNAQNIQPAKPKAGRYVQFDKEIVVRFGSNNIGVELINIDVLNDKDMKINFIISNPRTSGGISFTQNRIPLFYIVDENLTKYKPLSKLTAGWDIDKKGRYVLGVKEKTKGSILFPLLEEGARKFDLYIGYDKKISDLQLID